MQFWQFYLPLQDYVLPLQVPFTIVVKAFQATMEFINVHLQQFDQVTSRLIVCTDTRCLLWLQSELIQLFSLYTITTLATLYGFVVFG